MIIEVESRSQAPGLHGHSPADLFLALPSAIHPPFLPSPPHTHSFVRACDEQFLSLCALVVLFLRYTTLILCTFYPLLYRSRSFPRNYSTAIAIIDSCRPPYTPSRALRSSTWDNTHRSPSLFGLECRHPQYRSRPGQTLPLFCPVTPWIAINVSSLVIYKIHRSAAKEKALASIQSKCIGKGMRTITTITRGNTIRRRGVLKRLISH